jgi:CO/xanthine dehydrogenase FAD-binding subunit
MMSMRNPTGYYRPKTVEEAVRLLTQTHLSTALLSGGAFRLTAPDDPDYEALVDVQEIAELSRIETTADGTLRIGAAASLEALRRHAAVPGPVQQVLERAFTWNRRNAVSIAEAIEYPDRAAELMAALLALRASLIFAMPEGMRQPLSALTPTVSQPNLTPRRLILSVEIPPTGPWQTWGAAHVARTPSDTAIVSAVAVLVADQAGVVMDASVALSGVWERPAEVAAGASTALVGGVLDETRIADAVAALDGEIAPVADFRGSVTYRREMAAVLTRRALEQCHARLVE